MVGSGSVEEQTDPQLCLILLARSLHLSLSSQGYIFSRNAFCQPFSKKLFHAHNILLLILLIWPLRKKCKMKIQRENTKEK